MIPVSAAASQALRDKWDAFEAEAALRPTTVRFNEEEVTSRGVDFMEEEDIPLNDLQVFFCEEGYAEATASTAGINLLTRGTLDLTRDVVRIDIQRVHGGNLPSFIPIARLITRFSEAARKLDELKVNITSVTFTDGQVELRGEP